MTTMELPARFGKYELLEHLATGGMAEVYLARSFGVEGFQKRVVIKRILPGLAHSPRFVSMFIQEAKITAGLSHPNIVQVFELGRVGADHFIAMEYIRGQDLTRINKTMRRAGRRMPIPLAIYCTANLLRGLGHAHGLTNPDGRPLGLVHRDVSPHNVMVSHLGEIKLFDFGIARLLGEASERRAAGRPGGGKFAYMSPEQAKGEPVDARSDIYSAGIVLYELLVGHRLFAHDDPAEKLRLVQNAVVPDPRTLVPGIPDELWALLKRMLSLDPDERPARAEDAEEALWAIAYSKGLRADASAMRALQAELFPQVTTPQPGLVDLRGLAAELQRIEDAAQRAREDEHKTPARTGERRPVVALIADVVGFTAPDTYIDPQQVVRRHFKFLRKVRETVGRFGGYLASFQDDSLVIFFGIPRSSEHDLERALACAQVLRRFGLPGAPGGSGMALSLGVHRGEVHLGRKTGRHQRYLARGDTIKLARLMCHEAKLGEVLVSDQIAAMAGDRFTFRRGPEVRLKGQQKVRHSFVLHGRRRRDVAATGRWQPRGQELDQLRAALDALVRGHGGVLSLVGDAGTGKTRLVRELVRITQRHEVPMYRVRSLPYGGDRALAAVVDFLGAVLGIEPGEGPGVVRGRLDRLTALGLDDAERAAFSALLGVGRGRLGRQDGRPLVVSALGSLIRGLARERALVVAIEDVQHLSSLDLSVLGQVVQATRNEPVIYLFTARSALPVQLGSADWEVHLGRLDGALVEALVSDLVGAKAVDADLCALVTRTAEGNPLYVAEVLGALVRSGRVVVQDGVARLVQPDRHVQLPPGLEGLLAIRLDRLDARSRDVIELAATIGSRFSLALLQEADTGSELEAALRGLEREGLIARDGAAGEYTFASTLVWEVARRGLLGVRKQILHARVATAMERLHAGRLDSHRLVIGRHCAAGGRYLDATRHALKAGDYLRAQQLLEPAASAWNAGLAWVEDARQVEGAPPTCVELEAELRLKAGAAWALAGEARRAELHLQIALDLASDLGDAELSARAQLELGRLYAAKGKSALAQVHLESARDDALGQVGGERRGWRAQVGVDAIEAMGQAQALAGHSEAAHALFEQALEAAGSDQALIAKARLGIAHCHILAGDEEAALPLLESVLDYAMDDEDRILAGRVINNIGIVHLGAGRHALALSRFRQALELRRGLGYRRGAAANLHNIGDTCMRLGDDGRAWAAFTQSRELAEEIGWRLGVIMNDVYMAYLEGRKVAEGGDVALFVARLRSAGEQASKLGDQETALTAAWLEGRLLIERGRGDEAREPLLTVLRDAIEAGYLDLSRQIRQTLEG